MNKCNDCGCTDYSENYGGDSGKRMKADGVCFSCSFWLNVLDNRRHLVVEGDAYLPGGMHNVPHDRKRQLGFGGHLFTFKTNDGEIIKSNNVSHRGDVPDNFRTRLPDNAVIIKENQ